METNLTERRWRKAHLIAWFLQMVPFIRFIAVTGSLAYDIAKPESDIDVFIIAKSRRIWTVRTFTAVFLKAIGQYRTDKKRAGKICPNRFVTDNYLLINPQNRYHAQDYTQMVPLFDVGGLYDKFVLKNQWMQQFGYFKPRRAVQEVQSKTPNNLRKIIEWILNGWLGDKLEDFFRKVETAHLMKDQRMNQPGSGLFVSDDEIRFHPKPR